MARYPEAIREDGVALRGFREHRTVGHILVRWVFEDIPRKHTACLYTCVFQVSDQGPTILIREGKGEPGRISTLYPFRQYEVSVFA